MKEKNPSRIAKRKAGYQKLLKSPEYKAARKEAMERAGGRCEGWESVTIWPATVRASEGIKNATAEFYDYVRCPNTERLHAHHLSYPKTRPVEARDLKILCEFHHKHTESQKMHKRRMF